MTIRQESTIFYSVLENTTGRTAVYRALSARQFTYYNGRKWSKKDFFICIKYIVLPGCSEIVSI